MAELISVDSVEARLREYVEQLSTIPPTIDAGSLYDLMRKVKRDPIGAGPYPRVSLFEAFNRIMTDLVILHGVKQLLETKEVDGSPLPFDAYTVNLGNSADQAFDIYADNGEARLAGEAFNVAQAYFQPKKGATLKKLREQAADYDFILLMYNSDATREGYIPRALENEYHLTVDVPEL